MIIKYKGYNICTGTIYNRQYHDCPDNIDFDEWTNKIQYIETVFSIYCYKRRK